MSPHGIARPQTRGISVDWPDAAKFHRARPNDVRKSVTKCFTTFSILASHGASGSKCTNLGPDVHQLKALSINLPNFVDFVNGMTDKNSKRHVSAWYAETTLK